MREILGNVIAWVIVIGLIWLIWISISIKEQPRFVPGPCELPPKEVQSLLGHSSIVMTMDVYGHLFPRASDKAELAQATRMLLA